MATSRARKEQDLKDLKDKFSKMKSAVFAGYSGVTVESVGKLRGIAHEQGIDYKVAKKTLFKLAAEDAGIEGFDVNLLDGPTAVAVSYDDDIAPAKMIKDFSKEDENLVIFAGIMDGKMIDKKQVMTLANLPGMDELRAMMLGSLMSPISGFARVSNGPLTGFVRILGELSKRPA